MGDGHERKDHAGIARSRVACRQALARAGAKRYQAALEGLEMLLPEAVVVEEVEDRPGSRIKLVCFHSLTGPHGLRRPIGSFSGAR